MLSQEVYSIIYKTDGTGAIKFGSWDKLALKNETDLTFYRTKKYDTWELIASSVIYNEKQMLREEK